MEKVLQSTNIYIDASYLRSIEFDVVSNVHLKFVDLCQSGELNLYTTSITKRENDSNIDKFSDELFTNLQRFRKKGRTLDIINTKIGNKTINEIKLDDIKSEIQEKVQKFYEESLVKEIDLPVDSTASVLDMYFNKEKPFGVKKKKSEFPDAFIFDCLTKHSKNEGTSFYVISTDPDFKDACADSETLEYHDSITKILNIYNSHKKLSEYVTTQVEAKMNDINDKIKDNFEWLGFYLDDVDGDVEEVTVDEIEVYDINIFNLEEDEAQIIISTKIKFSSQVIFDDPENGIYDSEDKVWISFETINVNIDNTVNIDTEIRILIDEDENLFDILELKVNDNEDIAISVDPYDY